MTRLRNVWWNGWWNMNQPEEQEAVLKYLFRPKSSERGAESWEFCANDAVRTRSKFRWRISGNKTGELVKWGWGDGVVRSLSRPAIRNINKLESSLKSVTLNLVGPPIARVLHYIIIVIIGNRYIRPKAGWWSHSDCRREKDSQWLTIMIVERFANFSGSPWRVCWGILVHLEWVF